MKKYLIFSGIFLSSLLIIYFFIPSSMPLLWQNGARQMYNFSYTNDLTVTMPSGGIMKNNQKVSGIINMRVYDAGNNTIQLGFQISPVSVIVDGKNVPGLEKLLSSYFLAEVMPDGKFIRFIFDPSVSNDEGKIIKNIIQSYQSIIVSSKFKSWKRIEEDGIGEYRSEYQVKKGYIVKKKLIYDAINNSGVSQSKDSAMSAVIGENSKIIINYGKSASWIESLRGVDNIDFVINKKKVTSSLIVTMLKLIDFKPDPALSIWKQENTFSSLATLWETGKRKDGSVLKDLETLALKEKFEGKTFSSLLKKFTVTGNMVPWDSICTLRDYLIVNPSQCGLVSEYLLGGSLKNVQQAALIHVLELTGHNEAQKALLNIINSRLQTPMNRVRSIIAISGISAVSDDSISGLQDLWESGGKGNAPELSKTAMLALGNISSRQNSSSGNDEEIKRKKIINDYLVKELSSASDADSLSTVLTAIRNTRDGAFIEHVLPKINDADRRIRISAMNAAISVGDDAACETVVDHLRSEKEKDVKIAALDSLQDRPVMESAVDFIADSIDNETNPDLRRSMIKYLVKNRNTSPDIKNFLQNTLKSETNSQNRRLIYQGLYSKQD